MMQMQGKENVYTNQKPHPPHPPLAPLKHTWSDPMMKSHPLKKPRPPVALPQEEEDEDDNYCQIPPLPSKKSGSRTKASTMRFLSPPLTLPDFVAQYSKQLPVQIKVTTGYCGPSSRLTISTDDIFNVHLVKRAKVVHLTDAHEALYSVPLNSSIEFGLVYDPVDSDKKGDLVSAGFKLRVSDMMSLDKLPKVLCCVKAWKGDSLAMEDMEQLVVKGVHQKSRSKSKRGLKVLSLRTKEEMLLPEDCTALFSTQPGLVKMLLVDMMQYVEDPLPSMAMVVLNGELYQNKLISSKIHELPDVLVSRVVHLSEVIVETSLISSAVIDTKASYLEGYSLEELHQMIDIPLEGGLLDVQVAVVELDETEKLYEDTRSIYEKFSPSRVKPIRDLLCDRAAAAQWLFSNVVLTGWRETHGIELDEPTYKYVTFSSIKHGGSVESVPDSKWSVGGGDGEPRNRRSLTFGGGQSPAVPKLPPRDTPRRGGAVPIEGLKSGKERGQRDFAVQEGRDFNTLPSSFRPNKNKSVDTPPPTLPRPQAAPPSPAPQRPQFVQPASCPQQATPTALQLQHPVQQAPPTQQTTPSHVSTMQQNGSTTSLDSSRHDQPPPWSTPKRGRNDDSLLDGSTSSCEDLDSGPRGVAGNKEASLEWRLAAAETYIKALQEEGKGQEVKWKLEMEKRLVELEGQVSDILHRVLAKSSSAQATPTHTGGCGLSQETSLKKLSVQQVQQMLAAMEMHQYMDTFKRERVSGDILMELGDQELKDDLGIDSKLHRIRLMKVISCQHSVTDIL